MDGANLFDEGQQKFCKIKSFKSLTIDIKEDPQGNVWFATQGGGLWRLDKNNAWKQYKYVENDSTSLVSDQINCLAIGEKGSSMSQPAKDFANFCLQKVYSTESPSMRQVRISRVLSFRRSNVDFYQQGYCEIYAG